MHDATHSCKPLGPMYTLVIQTAVLAMLILILYGVCIFKCCQVNNTGEINNEDIFKVHITFFHQ